MGKEENQQLEDIKKLLVLQLLNSGVSANTIAGLLEVDPANFSREFPVKKLLKKTKP